MTVLVANASGGVALAVIRSLGKKGIKVTGAAPRNAYPMYSKYCKDKIIYGTYNNRRDITGRLLQIVKENNYDVFLPVVDEKTLILLSRNKEKFEKYTELPIADPEILETASDKAKVMEIAEELGIPCPKTWKIDTIDEIDKIRDKLNFPVVIKPTQSYGARGLEYANSFHELKIKAGEIQKRYKSLLIQEFIAGTKYNTNLLLNKYSKLRAAIVHRCIRQFPVSGGVFTYSETVFESKLIKYSFEILKYLKYTGLASLEFLIDSRDKKPKLMEINPRFYGSLPLSIAAGVDFPYLLYRMALDGDIEKSFEYKIGVRYRNLLWGDTKHLLYVLLGKTGPNYRISKLKTLINFLKFHECDGYYIPSRDDPLPAIMKIKSIFKEKIDEVIYK